MDFPGGLGGCVDGIDGGDLEEASVKSLLEFDSFGSAHKKMGIEERFVSHSAGGGFRAALLQDLDRLGGFKLDDRRRYRIAAEEEDPPQGGPLGVFCRTVDPVRIEHGV